MEENPEEFQAVATSSSESGSGVNLYMQIGTGNMRDLINNVSENTFHGNQLYSLATHSFITNQQFNNYLNFSHVPFRGESNLKAPPAGTPVDVDYRKAGPYIIGTKFGTCPANCVQYYLGKSEETAEYFVIKMLLLNNDQNTIDDFKGKFLIQNEFNILIYLQNQRGVQRIKDFFKEFYLEETTVGLRAAPVYTGFVKQRICLVLDCLAPPEFFPDSQNTILLDYILSKDDKKLPEMESIAIFHEMLLLTKSLHDRNIVHRNITLANIIVNRISNRVSFINFGLGSRLLIQNEHFFDQRGSPAYIAPEIIRGKAYHAKPSDMWALGVTFYAMLMGKFPFYDSSINLLYQKIKRGAFVIPIRCIQSTNTLHLIRGLLKPNPKQRITVEGALLFVQRIIAELHIPLYEPVQIVPDVMHPDLHDAAIALDEVYLNRPPMRLFLHQPFIADGQRIRLNGMELEVEEDRRFGNRPSIPSIQINDLFPAAVAPQIIVTQSYDDASQNQIVPDTDADGAKPVGPGKHVNHDDDDEDETKASTLYFKF